MVRIQVGRRRILAVLHRARTGVYRGGGWDGIVFRCRTADRFDDGGPTASDHDLGFRSVLPAGQ